ncbi:FHA domain-containing protein FhaA isoform X5 [Drosophila sulfurigaster albostrigata]|uniref:FHA domain-containing protein FhaA isoform X5 n=1 Tax=Drosophila sulfurigaster albostrigata TaxID=89887 RepID=UPI002D21A992|nr:FHA domain-containing protein FhaA isoform X5 [Drosophila sulfurigaster albostrigata]
MHIFIQLLLCLAVVSVQGSGLGPEARSASPKDVKSLSAPVGVLDSVLRGKSRQSRCVRCYEDRYYSSGSDRYGGYSSRSGDDPRSASWYYSYDRYDDRGAGRDRDYDRYYGRDDRYAPRTYDRYEGRGYDDYYRRGSYDRGSGYGYGGYAAYDSRDRYYGDRYSDNSRDRYYDRSRTAYNSYDKYDPYDRYYSRYDFRNYRPWDETYSSSYGGRPRPLGGSYLFDRDSNAVPESQSDAANPNGDGPGGDGGGHKMPAAAAQTAPAPNESQLNDNVKDKATK